MSDEAIKARRSEAIEKAWQISGLGGVRAAVESATRVKITEMAVKVNAYPDFTSPESLAASRKRLSFALEALGFEVVD